MLAPTVSPAFPRGSLVAILAGLAASCAPAPPEAARSLPGHRPDSHPAQDAEVEAPHVEPPTDARATPPDAPAPTPGEHWSDLHKSSESCRDYRVDYAATVYSDPYGPKRKNGYDGYVWRQLEIVRDIDGVSRRHCVTIYHPPGRKNAEGRPIHVADRIDPAWYRLIERSLFRLPWLHLQAVETIVLDDRPILHGIASYSRNSPSDDARDGHTIWLHEHLFTGKNHWAPGNYGRYWAYHVQRDGVAVDGQPAEHELFSPVLLHEIGHLVNYNVVNGAPTDPACPSCAEMCGDKKSCASLDASGREAFCATAYCTGFGFESGTENWAEMYRWFYQGSAAREMLARGFPGCFEEFQGKGADVGLNLGLDAPWLRGLGGTEGYRRTLWDSCGRKACRER